MIIRAMINTDANVDPWWENGGGKLWEKYEHTRDKYGYLNFDETTVLDFFEAAERIKGWGASDPMEFHLYPVMFQTESGDNVWFENGKVVVCR